MTRAMARAVRILPLVVQAQTNDSLGGIFGGRNGTGLVCLRVIRFLLPQSISFHQCIIFFYSSIIDDIEALPSEMV